MLAISVTAKERKSFDIGTLLDRQNNFEPELVKK